MNASRKKHRLLLCLGLLAVLSFSKSVRAEYEEEAEYVDEREMVQEQGKTDNGFRKSTKKSRRTYYNEQQQKRKYFIPDTQRVDAGTFHVAFGAGGNFYTLSPNSTATGLRSVTTSRTLAFKAASTSITTTKTCASVYVGGPVTSTY
ncbi:MAG: hypothetical protein R3B54_14320 [Bdellovibrionota bacterium]